MIIKSEIEKKKQKRPASPFIQNMTFMSGV
jgi:hypothetical protein